MKNCILYAIQWDGENQPDEAFVFKKASEAELFLEHGSRYSGKIVKLVVLTDSERFVLEEIRDIYADEDDEKCNEIAAVIDNLLERSKDN